MVARAQQKLSNFQLLRHAHWYLLQKQTFTPTRPRRRSDILIFVLFVQGFLVRITYLLRFASSQTSLQCQCRATANLMWVQMTSQKSASIFVARAHYRFDRFYGDCVCRSRTRQYEHVYCACMFILWCTCIMTEKQHVPVYVKCACADTLLN